MAKEGSTIAGLMECFGTVVSVSLQHGVPLQVLVGKLSHTRFEPSGWTGNEQLGYAKSIMDYIFRWMELRFLSGKQLPLFTQQMLVRNDKAAKRQTMLPPAFRNIFTTAMRLAMHPYAPPAVGSWCPMGAATSVATVAVQAASRDSGAGRRWLAENGLGSDSCRLSFLASVSQY